jgi:hypothetical protein
MSRPRKDRVPPPRPPAKPPASGETGETTDATSESGPSDTKEPDASDVAPLPAGPRGVGEAPGNLGRRSDWFRRRSGGPS